ncbi:MAG: hypothetical protein Kow0090_04740 [Myxococcota bacterium]
MSEENKRALEMLKKALEIEERGYSYYDKTISTCKNEQGKKIFIMLRDDEKTHIIRIRDIYKSIAAGKGWTDGWEALKTRSEEIAALFKEIVESAPPKESAEKDDLKAILQGANFELATIRFYEEQLPFAENFSEKRFIEAMIMEEKGHHKALVDMHYYLTDPEGWLMEKERSTLDGA